MAKKSFLGSLVKLGGIAAATAVVYYKREEIRKAAQNVLDRCFPNETEPEEPCEEEIEIVIDSTERETKETVEETPEI